MTPYGFLAWVAAQGIKHIPKKLLIQAFNSFKEKLPGKEVILKTAKNLYDDVIKKTPTKNIADKVRDKLPIPKQYNRFKPEIVPKTKIVPKKPSPLGDALKTGKYTKVPTPSGLKPPGLKKSNVIPFPKKPPILKADGGSIDKALPKKSRDI